MQLDRNTNPDHRGKYAVVNLRRTKRTLGELNALLNHHGEPNTLDFGATPDTAFFLIRLKDKYAAPALAAYAMAAYADDPEYGLEVLNLAKEAAEHPHKRIPD